MAQRGGEAVGIEGTMVGVVCTLHPGGRRPPLHGCTAHEAQEPRRRAQHDFLGPQSLEATRRCEWQSVFGVLRRGTALSQSVASP